MKRLLFILFTVLLLAGCQSAAKFQEDMQAWKNVNIEKLIDKWGYPDSTMTAPNGNMVYVYANHSNYYVPQSSTTNFYGTKMRGQISGTSNTMTNGGYSVSLDCTIYVEFDKTTKRIVRILSRGNNCVA